jgi:hypothetical protein
MPMPTALPMRLYKQMQSLFLGTIDLERNQLLHIGEPFLGKAKVCETRSRLACSLSHG